MATVEAGVGPLGEQAPDEALAAAVAVHVGGVDERHAGVGGGAQDRERVVLAHGAPVGAELPRPEADDADGPAGPAEGALFHGPPA